MLRTLVGIPASASYDVRCERHTMPEVRQQKRMRKPPCVKGCINMQGHSLKDFIVDECVDGVLVRGGVLRDCVARI